MTGPDTRLPAVLCVTCHRPLRDTVSRACRRGPVCRSRAGIVVVTLQAGEQVRPVRDTHRGQHGDDQLALDLDGLVAVAS